jgi:hypothetical protein
LEKWDSESFNESAVRYRLVRLVPAEEEKNNNFSATRSGFFLASIPRPLPPLLRSLQERGKGTRGFGVRKVVAAFSSELKIKQ